MYLKRLISLVILLVAITATGAAQKTKQAKYPSLFWEITGNGLKKPSYLFGTMHVSSKMVFHLSDSFYHAIKSVDAVALELNPDTWQPQMVALDKLRQQYMQFNKGLPGDYMTESSFQLGKFDEELQSALSTEPTAVNSLLYRSYRAQEDFEENTFLDLYIFQTGKKLGKRATGVENYFEAEKIMVEAYSDMAKEKKRKQIDTDGESSGEIYKKIQDAYRRGDLDLMDSLDNMMERSLAFREKFLYKRNEIQAYSIDTILKRSSLFVGVGAAHLPGKRGVIELLRKMGYTLRPVKMNNRDAKQKEAIDKLRVPVSFSNTQSADGFYNVALPGTLYSMANEYSPLDRWQYSDMSNGCYYLVTRVKTHAAFTGKSPAEVLKKIDSMLYENIPGKILSKQVIERNGYKGYDIVNKNRTGDVQHYQIFVTPFEVIVFKMGGKENYVQGTEAKQFFGSIKLRPESQQPVVYSPAFGDFSIKLPQQPTVYLNKLMGDTRWEYDALDKTTGNAYLVLKKSVYNTNFLGKDSFDLALIEESFRSADFFGRQISRTYKRWQGYPCLDVVEKLKDSSLVAARYIVKGPHYYALAAHGQGVSHNNDFFKSFSFAPLRYSSNKQYTDTFYNMAVNTPVYPAIDSTQQAMVALFRQAAQLEYEGRYTGYWPESRNALFANDSTGEMVALSVEPYPEYFYFKDTAKIWTNNQDTELKTDLVIYKQQRIKLANGAYGFERQYRDTGSSRNITELSLLKGNKRYSAVTMGDTLTAASNFIQSFFNSLLPDDTAKVVLTESQLPRFFNDLFSKDSATHAKAFKALSNLHYGEKGVPLIMDALQRLKLGDKDYLDTKLKLIAELGYIKDTTSPVVVASLRQIYQQAGDTSSFQNEVVTALARHRTKESIQVLKEIMLQDPPVFENEYDMESIFNSLSDTLALSKQLYPDLLQLMQLDDYRDYVRSLLVTLVDSGFVDAKTYESYYPKLYFDARLALKKQQGKDEKAIVEAAEKKDKDDEGEDEEAEDEYGSSNSELSEYAVLLMPFYNQYPAVPKFFDKLLRSKDKMVQMDAAILLLRNKKPVPDSLFTVWAANDKGRGLLYEQLEEIKRLDKFPAAYFTQVYMARSNLLDGNSSKPDSIVYLRKQLVSSGEKTGWVYFFKYRLKKEGDWKIGISGLQPFDEKKADDNSDVVSMTDRKLKEDEPELFDKLLKKALFETYKSGTRFYGDGYRYNSLYRRMLNNKVNAD